jgi:hypothetical protein
MGDRPRSPAVNVCGLHCPSEASQSWGYRVTESNDVSINDEIQRRDFIKKAAVIAWSAPVIMTLSANRAEAHHRPGHTQGGNGPGAGGGGGSGGGGGVGGGRSCVQRGVGCVPSGLPCCSGSSCMPQGRSGKFACR